MAQARLAQIETVQTNPGGTVEVVARLQADIAALRLQLEASKRGARLKAEGEHHAQALLRDREVRVLAPSRVQVCERLVMQDTLRGQLGKTKEELQQAQSEVASLQQHQSLLTQELASVSVALDVAHNKF